MINVVDFPSQGLPLLSVTNDSYGRVSRFQVARKTTVISAQLITSCLIDLLDIVHITAGDGIIVQFEQNTVLLLLGLHLLFQLIISLA